MTTSPTTALIATLATAAGTLTAYYTPALIPGLIFGVLAWLAVVTAAARLLHLNLDRTLIGASRCLLVAVAVVLTAVLRGCITGLNALARWDTSQLTRTGATP